MLKKQYLFVCIALLQGLFLLAQTKPPVKKPKIIDPKVTDEKYKNQDYFSALEDYLILIEKDPDNKEYLERLANCYLNTGVGKDKAVEYLEKLIDFPKHDPNLEFDLGRAYSYAYKFDEAIETFTKFKENKKGKSENLKAVDRLIEQAQNAKELLKFPASVYFTNLGKNINSKFPDYNAFVPIDESFVVYNSRRGGKGAIKDDEGNFLSGILISSTKDGEFQKSKSIGSPLGSSDGDIEVVGLSSAGDQILVWKYDPEKLIPYLYISTYDPKLKKYKKPIPFEDPVTSKDEIRVSASISSDGNSLYFSAEKSEGIGGTDIYVTRKLPTGKWGPAQNLGAEINTPYDEEYPNISPDGKTLYFSSRGLLSMGGFDIFKSTWNEDEQIWNKATNMGYPINTPDDDMNFRISASGRYGYVSQTRSGGEGDLDIYRVTFNDIDPVYTVIKGEVGFSDSTATAKYKEVQILVKDTKTNKLFGKYTPNSVNGKYIIIAPPGDYEVSINIPGFEPIMEKLMVEEKIAFNPERQKNFTVSPNSKLMKELNKKF